MLTLLQRKYIAALRSDNYRRNYLNNYMRMCQHINDDTLAFFSALGVACEVAGIRPTFHNQYNYDGFEYNMPPAVVKKYNFYDSMGVVHGNIPCSHKTIFDMSTRMPFDAIADLLVCYPDCFFRPLQYTEETLHKKIVEMLKEKR